MLPGERILMEDGFNRYLSKAQGSKTGGKTSYTHEKYMGEKPLIPWLASTICRFVYPLIVVKDMADGPALRFANNNRNCGIIHTCMYVYTYLATLY